MTTEVGLFTLVVGALCTVVRNEYGVVATHPTEAEAIHDARTRTDRAMRSE